MEDAGSDSVRSSGQSSSDTDNQQETSASNVDGLVKHTAGKTVLRGNYFFESAKLPLLSYAKTESDSMLGTLITLIGQEDVLPDKDDVIVDGFFTFDDVVFGEENGELVIEEIEPWVIVAARRTLATDPDRFLPTSLLAAFFAECHKNLPFASIEQSRTTPDFFSTLRQHIWKAFDTVTGLEVFLHGASTYQPNAPLYETLDTTFLTTMRDELQQFINKSKPSLLAAKRRLRVNATEQQAHWPSGGMTRATNIDGCQNPMRELARIYAKKASYKLVRTMSSLDAMLEMMDMIVAGPAED